MLRAEELCGPININENAPLAISMHGDFTYPSVAKIRTGRETADHSDADTDAAKKNRDPSPSATSGDGESQGKADTPFALRGIDLQVPQGKCRLAAYTVDSADD